MKLHLQLIVYHHVLIIAQIAVMHVLNTVPDQLMQFGTLTTVNTEQKKHKPSK